MLSPIVSEQNSVLGCQLSPSSVSFVIEGQQFQFCSVESDLIIKARSIINKPNTLEVDSYFHSLLKFERLIDLVASKQTLTKGQLYVNGLQLNHENAEYFDHVICQVTDSLVPKILPSSYEKIFTFKEDLQGVFKVTIASELLLSYVFLRFQEHYESPEFKNQVFSRKEFVDWYTADQGAGLSFTYYRDWAGFNLPSESLRSFLNCNFNDILPGEEFLIKGFESVFAEQRDRFYVIGLAETSLDWTYEHEQAHALYSLNANYRTEVNIILDSLPENLKEIYQTRLLEIGYDDAVIKDESQAYLIHLNQNHYVFNLQKDSTEYQLLTPFHKALAGVFTKYKQQLSTSMELNSADLPALN